MTTFDPIAIKKGRTWRPDVFHVNGAGLDQIWKDYRHLAGPIRGRVGRWLFKREQRFLHLVGARGDAPFPMVSPQPLILAMTFIEGRELVQGDDKALESLDTVVARLHRKGMAHNDLHRSNVRVVGERVVLLDFGAAVCLPKVLKPITLLLQRRDRHHVRKLQARFGSQPLNVPVNPWWVKALQSAWNQLRRKPSTPQTAG